MAPRTTKLTGWRRIANAMWRAPDDPQIYGILDVDATGLLAFIERTSAVGERLTVTHLVGRAIAQALLRVPDLNVRFVGSRAVPRRGVDIFFITAVHRGHDLSGVKVANVDQLSALEVADALDVRARDLKGGRDPEFLRAKATMDALPRPLLRLALRGTMYVAENLDLDVPPLGIHRNPFGSAMVTSVGMFGLPQGFAPLAWMYRVPLIVLVGELTERALVVDSEVVVRPVLPLTATIDHRYVDGWHVSHALAAFRAYLEAPERFEPEPVAHRRDAAAE